MQDVLRSARRVARRAIGCMVAVAALMAGIAASVPASGRGEEAASASGIQIPPGYRDWRLVSVAHEEGNLNDIRAILGNDAAIEAYRSGKIPFPDGSILARIAWKDVSSEENNRAFGRNQSFIAGPPPDWYLQLMVKDSKKYASTGGWGFAQFNKDGKPVDAARLATCFSCHTPVQSRDFVFTRYAQ